MTQDRLTDLKALTLHRARAGGEGAWFLHDEAIYEVQERLSDVNRTFTKAAIVTGFPQIWAAAAPDARMVPEAEVLDLAPASCDLIIHAMGLHWSNDPVGQLIQCRRALQPDGLLLVVCFGGETLHELRSALAEAEVTERGGMSPRVLPMGEVRDLGALLQRAGLALPVADTSRRQVLYRDLMHLARDLRAMGETNAMALRDKRTPPRGLFAKAHHIYAQSHGTAEGQLRATFDLVFLTGWAPADSQPQPLRPGSATTRLADVLGTVEINPERDKT